MTTKNVSRHCKHPCGLRPSPAENHFSRGQFFIVRLITLFLLKLAFLVFVLTLWPILWTFLGPLHPLPDFQMLSSLNTWTWSPFPLYFMLSSSHPPLGFKIPSFCQILPILSPAQTSHLSYRLISIRSRCFTGLTKSIRLSLKPISLLIPIYPLSKP